MRPRYSPVVIGRIRSRTGLSFSNGAGSSRRSCAGSSGSAAAAERRTPVLRPFFIKPRREMGIAPPAPAASMNPRFYAGRPLSVKRSPAAPARRHEKSRGARRGGRPYGNAFLTYGGSAPGLVLFREVAHLDGLLELEVELGFRRDLDLLALGQNLNGCAGAGTDAGADCRAFTPAGDRADGRANGCAAADGGRAAFASGGSHLLVLTACEYVRLALELHAH